MLQVQHIYKEYHTGKLVQKALDDFSLNLRDNEFVAILGPSGSGKTTLLNIIGGLDQYDSGEMIINGISTKKYKDRDWDSYRNHTIGFVFQSYNLIPHQTLLSNVELALTISGVSKKERRRRAREALRKVGLGEQVDKRPNQLSGGQMQRVAIARALVNDPDILLADEPTGALDSATSIQVMDLLKEVAEDRLVVMVTHNPELAEEYATRIVKLRDGKMEGDSDPYVVEEEEQPGKSYGNMGKSFMKLPTAVSLSFNNLLTKKARTLLTAFAGSIGIIGIALILSLSTGVNDYIAEIEEETLSGYPLQIMSSGFDMSALLSGSGGDSGDEEEQAEDRINIISMITAMLSRVEANDLGALKEYLDSGQSGADPYINAIEYEYDVTPQIYLEYDNGDYRQVNPDSSFSVLGFGSGSSSSSMISSFMSTDVFYELPETEKLYKDQYEVMAGHWPEAYNEIVLVLSSSGSISDFMLYSLGLRNGAELDDMVRQFADGEMIETPDDIGTYTYEDVLGLTFRLVCAADYYEYDDQYEIWKDKTENTDYMKKLVADGEELTIVGVVQPVPDAAISMLSSGLYYSSSLTDHVAALAAESEIVKDQLAHPSVNIFTGESFGEETEENSFDIESLFEIDEDALAEAFVFDTDALEEAFSESLDFSELFDFSEMLDLDSLEMPELDMSSLDMSAFDLSSLDLGSFDLSSLDLGSFDMSSLDLSGFDMSSLDLSAFDLSSLDLGSFDLSSLDLSGIDMSSLDLSAFDLSSLDLDSLDPGTLDLGTVDLNSLDLSSLSDTDLGDIELPALDFSELLSGLTFDAAAFDLSSLLGGLTDGYLAYLAENGESDAANLGSYFRDYLQTESARAILMDSVIAIYNAGSIVTIDTEQINALAALLVPSYLMYIAASDGSASTDYMDFLNTEEVQGILRDWILENVQVDLSVPIDGELLQALAFNLAEGYQIYAAENGYADLNRILETFAEYLSSDEVGSLLLSAFMDAVDIEAAEEQIDALLQDYMSAVISVYSESLLSVLMDTIMDTIEETIQTQLSSALSESMSQISAQIGEQINAQISSMLSDVMTQMSAQIGEQINAQISSMMSETMTQMMSDVMSQMVTQMMPEVMNQIMTQMSSQIGEQINSQISDQITSAMSQMMEELTAQITDMMTDAMTSMVGQMTDAISESMEETLSESMTDTISESMSDVMADAMEGAMDINEDAFMNAFTFNMDSDDLTELIVSMTSASSSTYSGNLAGFGYVDFDTPSEIDIYPIDFPGKEEVVDILDAYNDRMEQEGNDEKVITYTDTVGTLMSSVTDIVDIISYVLIAFVGISLVVSSIMIGVITYISVLERQKEIGILRAIGASKGNISQVFNAETGIIGLFAGLLGIGLARLLMIPGNAIIRHFAGDDRVKMLLMPQYAAALVLLSVVLTLIGGLIPSSKAAGSDPVKALRTD